MKRSCVYISKPGGYLNLKSLKNNEQAQTGIVSFFIGAMIAVIIALQVTWPVIDSVLASNSTANMSSAATTLLDLIPLFLVLSVVMIFIRPLM